jgi:hypothetical protein
MDYGKGKIGIFPGAGVIPEAPVQDAEGLRRIKIAQVTQKDKLCLSRHGLRATWALAGAL